MLSELQEREFDGEEDFAKEEAVVLPNIQKMNKKYLIDWPTSSSVLAS